MEGMPPAGSSLQPCMESQHLRLQTTGSRARQDVSSAQPLSFLAHMHALQLYRRWPLLPDASTSIVMPVSCP